MGFVVVYVADRRLLLVHNQALLPLYYYKYSLAREIVVVVVVELYEAHSAPQTHWPILMARLPRTNKTHINR